MKIKKILSLILCLAMVISTVGMTTLGVAAEGETVTVQTAPEGTITLGYTRQDGVWGEARSNSQESFYVELYAGEDKIATTTLNNVGGIIDGDLYVTWSIPFAGSTDEYWTVEWEEGHPTARIQPTKVVLYSDGVRVAENDVQMNGPDNLNPVVWAELDYFNLEGEGTAESPYLINNIDDLKAFRDDVNAGNTYEGEYVLLTDDINFEDYEEMNVNYQGNNISARTFRPIGDSSCDASFKGTFNGGEHTISGLYISGWDINYHWDNYGCAGLFGTIENATIKNLTMKNVEIQVEGGDVAGIAGHAVGDCTFENITITDSKVATYNNGCAGIVAWTEAGNYAFKDITVDDKVVLAGLWGSFDSSIGGVVAQADNNASYDFKNVDVACRLDIYNDVTASYKYYNYRMCGMLIGRVMNFIDGENEVNPEHISCENVNITIGEWANYTYIWDDSLSYGCKRVEPGYTYDGVDVTQYPEAEIILLPQTSIFGGGQYGYSGSTAEELEDLGFEGIVVTDLAKKARSVAAVDGEYFTTLDAAIAAAAGAEITLLNNADLNTKLNNATINIDLNGYKMDVNVGANYIIGENSISNGTVDISNASSSQNIFGLAQYQTPATTLTMDKVNFIGDGFNSGYAVFEIGNSGADVALTITDSTIDLKNDNASQGGFVKGYGPNCVLTITNTEVTLDNTDMFNVNVAANITDSKFTIANLSDTVFRNLGGTIDNSTITIDGAEYGIKNTGACEALTVTDSKITVTNTENESNNAGIYLTGREKLADTNSIIDAQIYIEGGVVYNTLTFETNGGNPIASVTDKEAGAIVDLSEYRPEKSGYTFAGWYSDAELTQKISSITLDDVKTVYAKWRSKAPVSGGSGTTNYAITFKVNGGTDIAKVSKTKNTTLDLSGYIPEKEGYRFDGWYTDKEMTNKVTSIKLTEDITVYAKWTKLDNETDGWKNPFTDVNADDWYYANVRYAEESNLMNGTSETTFSPNDSLTRAMLVTVLYRLEGEPATNKSIPFADVDMGSYYANAVSWAKQNDIVNGVTETEFAPNEDITREQIATIMHRYAQFRGYDVSVAEKTNILSYSDFAQISEYAAASMQYAVGSGILRGKTETTLNPKDNATRAEIAAILQRFIEANNN